ncbi:hypothetical protein C5167_044790 [Papaver somniferum]|nr:hypothetical protein C5167_044790 [Papaver somniferum]
MEMLLTTNDGKSRGYELLSQMCIKVVGVEIWITPGNTGTATVVFMPTNRNIDQVCSLQFTRRSVVVCLGAYIENGHHAQVGCCTGASSHQTTRLYRIQTTQISTNSSQEETSRHGICIEIIRVTFLAVLVSVRKLQQQCLPLDELTYIFYNRGHFTFYILEDKDDLERSVVVMNLHEADHLGYGKDLSSYEQGVVSSSRYC